MTLQDLAFEGIYSYKKKMENAEKEMQLCIDFRENLIENDTSDVLMADYDEFISYWVKDYHKHEELHREALKLYEETFC